MNKKYSLIILVFVIFAALVIFFHKSLSRVFTDKQNAEQELNNDTGFIDPLLVKLEKENLIDTDGDGLYDWEEDLWPELDPKNPDSDADGVSDYFYLQRKKQKIIIEKAPAEQLDLSATQELSQNLYTALSFIAEANSGDITDEERASIEKNIQEYITNLDTTGGRYLREDVAIVDSDYESNIAYENAMKKLLADNPISLDELEDLYLALSDPELYLFQVSKIKNKFEDFESALAQVDVPRPVVKRHLNLLNFIASVAEVSKNISSSEIDDALNLAFVLQLNYSLNQAKISVEKIYEYFDLVHSPSF